MKNSLNVHSYETFGTVDGPGIRFVLFLNGCPLRCRYCHNPDTWALDKKNYIDNDDIVKQINSYKAFSKTGAITVSGGEPLLQASALIDLFKKLKNEGIHTCIDTSGYMKITDDIKELLSYTDLVLLDIKHIDNQKHLNLVKKPNDLILEFARFLDDIKKPVWIRHVLVPGYTNDLEDLKNLRKFIDSLSNVEKVEVLPYHVMGVNKYETLGLSYDLDVDTPTKVELRIAKEILIK